MDDLTQTTDAVELRGWEIVLLRPRSKEPTGKTWQIVTNPSIVNYHAKNGGNLGLVCGKNSGVMVLDFDAPGAMIQMFTQLGALAIWVETGSGKHHCYVRWQDGMPPKMMWGGTRVGEVQRGPMQQVVMPPSIHPDSGKPYRWLADPNKTVLQTLPDEWITYLTGANTLRSDGFIPSYIDRERIGQPEEEPWTGPSPTELQSMALRQPGATRRRYGIKFQCPGCRKEGHDKHMDNAVVYDDGRWGCALDVLHRKDLAEIFGLTSPVRDILGDLADEFSEPTIDDI